MSMSATDLFDNDFDIELEASARAPIVIDVDENDNDTAKVASAFTDNLWDDLGNEPSESVEQVLAKAARAAKDAHKNTVFTSSIAHEVLPSSSPTRPDASKTSGKDVEKKEKRKPFLLNEGVLIGETGFKLLIKDTKDFKPKGKGHEEKDLDRLLQRYQFWTQRMYPKSQFKDTVERVERLCRKRVMHSHLSSWRDEVKGITKEPDADVGDAVGEEHEHARADEPISPSGADAHFGGNESEVANYASSSPPPTVLPPSSPGISSGADDMPEDDEALMELLRQENSAQPPQSNHLSDDDDAWNEMDPTPSDKPRSALAATLQRSSPDIDIEMGDDFMNDDVWDAIDELSARRKPQTSAPPPAPPVDEEDDLYI